MRFDDVVVRPHQGVVVTAVAALVKLDGDVIAEPGDGAHGVALDLAHKVHLAPVEGGA